MKINKIRNFLRATNKVLGDVNAVNRGKVGRRVKNRVIGKQISKWMKW